MTLGRVASFVAIVVIASSVVTVANSVALKVANTHKRVLPVDWRAALERELHPMKAILYALEWRLETDPDVTVARAATDLNSVSIIWRDEWCEMMRGTEAEGSMEMHLLCRGPSYTTEQAIEVSSLQGDLQDIYSSSRVCRPDACLGGEPDLERLMRASRDDAELRWAWQGWRRAVGPPSRRLYTQMVDVMNQGARNNGYRDIGECWREELATPHLEEVVERLYQQVEPLYVLLHAVVRHRLVQLYDIDPIAPIPAHLLGNMWAQNWATLLDLVLPNCPVPDITAAMREKNYTLMTMMKHAEDFYTSLRLPRMTDKFWRNSRVTQRAGNGSCHGTAGNMFSRDDYRMSMCAEVAEEDLYVMHHEMGHIEYYMAYRDQPVIFQDAPTSAFQEAMADTIMYGVLAPQHLQRLGLIDESMPVQALDTAILLRQALNKLPELAFSLLVDKWRYAVFRGDVQPCDYNAAWWELRTRYQGIMPPVDRAEDDFDPAAKFHIPDNTPYIRYFLSGVLQVQMFKGLCQAAVTGHVGGANSPIPLHRCDIYGSIEAGNKLRSMMKLGASRPWQDALELLTGARDYSVAPLLEYYAPVYDWLQREVRENNIPVGW